MQLSYGMRAFESMVVEGNMKVHEIFEGRTKAVFTKLDESENSYIRVSIYNTKENEYRVDFGHFGKGNRDVDLFFVDIEGDDYSVVNPKTKEIYIDEKAVHKYSKDLDFNNLTFADLVQVIGVTGKSKRKSASISA